MNFSLAVETNESPSPCHSSYGSSRGQGSVLPVWIWPPSPACHRLCSWGRWQLEGKRDTLSILCSQCLVSTDHAAYRGERGRWSLVTLTVWKMWTLIHISHITCTQHIHVYDPVRTLTALCQRLPKGNRKTALTWVGSPSIAYSTWSLLICSLLNPRGQINFVFHSFFHLSHHIGVEEAKPNSNITFSPRMTRCSIGRTTPFLHL